MVGFFSRKKSKSRLYLLFKSRDFEEILPEFEKVNKKRRLCKYQQRMYEICFFVKWWDLLYAQNMKSRK